MLRLEPPTGVAGKFGAAVLDGSGATKATGKSATLADAVENAMIELRANASQPRPSPKPQPNPFAASPGVYVPPTPKPTMNGQVTCRSCGSNNVAPVMGGVGCLCCGYAWTP